MASDNLTLKLKEQLAQQGFAATDQEIDNYLKSLKSPTESITAIKTPQNNRLPDWLTQPSEPESKISLIEGVGATAWNLFDTALFSLPGIVARRQGKDKIFDLELDPEKRGPAGKVGGVIGEAIGFLLPMKWVSKGVGYGVKSFSKLGGKRVADDLVKGSGYFKGDNSIYSVSEKLGFTDKEALRGALSRTFKSSDEAVTRGVSAYGVSGEAIKQTKSALKANIGSNIKEAFPDMDARRISELAEAVTIKLGEPGFHINSVGNWIQRVMNAKIGLDEAGKISKYITHAGEMTTNFALYNILTDGIQSLAGEREFDPVQDVYDALIFSAFLPFVEMIPGGGKVPIASTAKKILDYTSKGFKKADYKKYSADELNGLLQIISNNNSIRQAPFWEAAYRNSGGKLTKDKALEVLETIRKTGNLDNIWRDFAKEAGSDLSKSVGRMMAGAAYFNSHTLLDPEMIRNVDPEVLGAHMLVGAFFTRMRKPIFENPSPYMTDFQSKVELLRNFGIDASSLKAHNSYFTARNMLAGAQSGSLTNEKISQIHDIFYNKELMKEVDSRENIGNEVAFDIEAPEYNIVRMVKDIADIRRFNERVGEGKSENFIELTQLTKKQADIIKEKLEEIVIDKEKNIKLKEENFDDYYLEIQNELQIDGGKSIVNSLFNIAKLLGLSTDGKASDFSFDKQNIRMASIEGTSISDKMPAIVEFQKILNRFKDNGSIGRFEAFTSKTYSELENDPNISELNKKVQRELDSMVKELRDGSFSKDIEVHIHPSDNAWLDLFDSRHSHKTLNTIYNVIRGRGLDKPGIGNEIKSMHNSTKSILGDKLPPERLISELIKIDPELKPETMESSRWEQIKTKELFEVEKDLQHIARIWATDKNNTKPDYNTDKILYEDAKALVDAYKNTYPKAFSIKDAFLDRLNNYHHQREFKDLKLGNRESGILSLASVYNALQKSEDGADWTMMDRNGFEKYLKDRSIGEKETAELLKKFDKLRGSLSRIDGKYLHFVNHLETRGPNESDMIGFVNEAHGLTRESVQEVLMSYENVVAKTGKQNERLSEGQSIIDKLYDNETESIRKLEFSDTTEMALEIKNLLKNHESTKDKSSFDKQFYSYFERLLSQIQTWQKGNKVEPFSSTERNYISGNDLIIGRGNKLSELNQQIMKMQLLSSNTLWGQRNSVRMRDELIATLSRKLNKLNIELGKEKTLEAIYEKYDLGDVNSNLKIDNYIREFQTKSFAFERNMSKEQYDLLRQEVARNREAFESNFDKTPKETYQSVENKYGEFNENLRGDNYQRLKENITIAIKEKKDVNKAATELLNEIHLAIDNMNKPEVGPASPKQLRISRDQKAAFNERFAGLLAQSYGTDNIKYIHFSENGAIPGDNKTELIIETKTEAAGAGSDFQKILFDNYGVSVYNIGKSAVYGNKTYPEIADIPLSEAEINSRIQTPGNVKENGESDLRKFRGVKITVSKWDQLYLRTDNIRGEVATKFKEGFNKWYDGIMNKLPDPQSKRNFETMYGHMREMDQITLQGPLREIIKAQYLSHLSEANFIELIKSANSRQDMNNNAVSLLKYLHYMRTGGAQVKGSKEFLNTMYNIGRQQLRDNGFWYNNKNNVDNWAEIERAIINYNRKPNGFEVVSIKEDSGTGGLSAYQITKEQLKKRLSKSEKGTDHYDALKEMISELDKGDEGKFSSILASGVDAQSWLGTDAAHISYLHRGRSIYDDLAGIKPTGYSNSKDILLKTNFIYDKDIADLMQRANIDILTTESAAKRFGAGHTELKINGKTIESKDFNGYTDAFLKSEESLTNGIRSNLKVEDLYFGKTTDRKMVNVSYAMTNFLNKIGYGEFTKDQGYYSKIENAIGSINNKILNERASERNAEFMNTLKMARENGDIFSDGTSGSIDRLIRIGADVQSDILLPEAQRIITRRILGEISKPETPWGSHSVLIPYLEGKAPVYAKIGNKDKQIVYGGKKLSYQDGELQVDNIKDLKFIVEHKNLNRNTGDRYDIQIGFDSRGKILLNHPITGAKLKDPSLKKAIEKRIETVSNTISRNNGVVTMKAVHDILTVMNKGASKVSHGSNYSDIKMFLHSLSLRIPNIGGDVAVHKIEGFYNKEIGNVVGINPMDLAVKHQGDFDVDMAHSYHRMPWEVASSITDNLAKTPDAKVYPSKPLDFDLFNMGPSLGPVGINENLDSLEPHYNRYRNAQNVFGSIMNIAPGIGALERIGFKINNKETMMDMSTNKFIPIKQRLKNVLQSIIDSTKTDNFASLGSREELLKFVLFGRNFGGSESAYRLSEYNEKGINTGKWEGMFKFPKDIKGNKKLVLEDAILKALSIVNSSNRVLSGVTDEAGRRPPNLNQMMRIRNRIERFFDNPGATLFNELLFEYKVLNKDKSNLQNDLIDLFYNIKSESFTDAKELIKEIYSKKQLNPVIRNSDLFTFDAEASQSQIQKGSSDGNKLIHKIGVGGIILDKFGTMLNDKTKWVKTAYSAESKQAYNLLDRIEASFLLGTSENLNELIINNKINKEFADWLKEENISGSDKGTFSDFGDIFRTDLANYNIGQIQKYSVLNHVIDKETRGLRNFINSNAGNKYKNSSMIRAQLKLKTLEAAKDHLLDKEVELIDGSIKDAKDPKVKRSNAYNYFKFKDYDLSKSKSGMNVYNRESNYKYIYKLDKVRNGRVKYSFYGTLSPGQYGRSGKKFLRKGSKYVVMDNPIRHELMSTREVKDAYALLEVTGEALAANIEGIGERSIDPFYDRLGQLKKDMYELSSETFKMSNKSAFASRNWSEAAEKENMLLTKFFEQTRKDIAGEGQLTNEAIFTIASILVKPRQTSSMVKLSQESPIQIPSFKINKRMFMAVERFLHSGGEKYADIYTSLFKGYGDAYRRKNDRIIDSKEELMYQSDMYQNGPLYPSRDPALDLAMGTYGYMYIPSILQTVRGSFNNYGGRAYKTYDSYGNVRRMINYERVGTPELLGEYYSTEKNFKDAVNTKERCY